VQKVLIITYYWPPTGGSGVQRWLKFTKYLREFGWEPIIYTPQNPEVAVTDDSLQKDIPKNLTVIRRKVLEPYRFFRFINRRKTNMGVGFTSSENYPSSLVSWLSIWIRGNLFIPDPRILWVKPSIRFLKKYIQDNHIDVIVTTGPPHSMHLIGLGLREKLNIKWIADFRDPWTKIDFINSLKLNRHSFRKHIQLEKNVVESSDLVVVVSPQMKKDFESYQCNWIEVITNGFDEDDIPKNTQGHDSLFTITHVGSIPPNRNCPALWQALKSMVDSDQEFASKLSIQLLGSVDSSVIADIESNGLKKHFKNFGYVVHDEGIRIMQRSQILLLLVNNSPNATGILTGKVFEYLAAQRPIMAIAPKGGDLDILLSKTASGLVASCENKEAIKENLKWFWYQYKLSLPYNPPQEIYDYSRKNLTKELACLLNNLIK
jgi:hypothetical protein